MDAFDSLASDFVDWGQPDRLILWGSNECDSQTAKQRTVILLRGALVGVSKEMNMAMHGHANSTIVHN